MHASGYQYLKLVWNKLTVTARIHGMPLLLEVCDSYVGRCLLCEAPPVIWWLAYKISIQQYMHFILTFATNHKKIIISKTSTPPPPALPESYAPQFILTEQILFTVFSH
jgi:hypothetical protein